MRVSFPPGFGGPRDNHRDLCGLDRRRERARAGAGMSALQRPASGALCAIAIGLVILFVAAIS